MEKLSTKQQAEVGKMSTERLHTKLAKAGYDEETVATADRTVLQNMFAEYLLVPPQVAAVGGATKGSMTEEEMDLRREELELRKEEIKLLEKEREEEMELRKKAEERAEKRTERRT